MSPANSALQCTLDASALQVTINTPSLITHVIPLPPVYQIQQLQRITVLS